MKGKKHAIYVQNSWDTQSRQPPAHGGPWTSSMPKRQCNMKNSEAGQQTRATCLWCVLRGIYVMHSFINTVSYVNEPCAMKFVVQRSNRCIATSVTEKKNHCRSSLLPEIPLESEGQWCVCSFSSECNLPSVFAGLVSGCQLAGWWDSTCCSTDDFGLSQKLGNCHSAFQRLEHFFVSIKMLHILAHFGPFFVLGALDFGVTNIDCIS